MKTREVADICGVSIPTITENAKKIGIVMEQGKPHEWTESELKKIQIELMKNQTNQGHQVEQVKNEVLTRFNTGLSLQVIMDSGNLDALEEFVDFVRKGTEARHNLLLEQQKNKELEEKNLLLIEQKEAAEAETERIFEYNKNFHHHLKTATELAKELGTSPNNIGRIANNFHLKQEPIYGKLGKIQLDNGRWVDIFYYNEDAQLVIANNL